MDPRLEQKFADIEDSYWWYVAKNRLVRQWLGRCGRVLDVGCGTGALFEAVAGQSDAPYGVDSSPVAMVQTHKRVPGAGLCRASVMHLPFQNAAFDALVASEVLEHIGDDRGALLEWHRILKPGGKLVLTTPAHPHLWGRHDELCHHVRRYRRVELGQKLREAGFRVERLSYTFSFLYPVMTALRPVRRRPRQGQGSLGDDFLNVPEPMNRLLIALLGIEARWLRRVNLPFGASLIALAHSISNPSKLVTNRPARNGKG